MNSEIVTINRNYKDTIFRMLFKNKKSCLELYNALNESDYQDENELEIVTLENAIYLSKKNDLAFILDYRLNLYEHQSSYNPNIPLRDLLYISAEYQKLIKDESLYSTVATEIPTPHFVVFYNGIQKRPEREILKLSTLYSIKEDEPMLELKVQVLNINSGYNEEIKNKCKKLYEYMRYVDRIRMYVENGYVLQEAVEQAVEDCIKEDILADFLCANKAEVIAMSIFEYDEEKEMRLYKKAEREAGRKEGFEEGINVILSLVKDGIITMSEAANRLNMTEEELKKYS